MIAILGVFFVLVLDLWRWLSIAVDEADPVRSAGTPSISCKAPKPGWVREEVIRMKALMPNAGCRSLELIFNRRFARTHGVTVRKTAAAIERVLAEAFRRFEPPRSLVTDNEGPFRSYTWKRTLARFRVQHRRTELYCPWQNGRIERFFGTLKRKIGQRCAAGSADLQSDLNVFRYWYNHIHIRPHQALYGAIHCRGRTVQLSLTPAEAWAQSGDRKHGSRFEGWGGLLRGWACRI